jgi:DNA-binding transcriptional regulator YdaS (Cro superfamily)
MDIIDIAAEACGGLGKLAAILGESPQTVANWRVRGIPIAHCAAMEAAAGWKVRRWDMRPGDWHRIWPELIGIQGAPPVPTASDCEA